MKARTFLVLSVSLNLILLGALIYLYRQIPGQTVVLPDIRVSSPAGAGAVSDSASPTAEYPRFGGVVEVVLPDQRKARHPVLFDLETGRHMAEPECKSFGCDATANIAWIRTNSLDIAGFVNSDGHVLCTCYYLAVVPVVSPCWEQMTAAQVLGHSELARITDPKRPVMMPAVQKTDTFLVRTADGTCGVLQVLGATRDLDGVMIRYKLVRPGQSAPPQSAARPTVEAESQAALARP